MDRPVIARTRRFLRVYPLIGAQRITVFLFSVLYAVTIAQYCTENELDAAVCDESLFVSLGRPELQLQLVQVVRDKHFNSNVKLMFLAINVMYNSYNIQYI
ncbi:PREDICTED: uncharacterized protein LOC106751478 [Dinoponera quadriceps]|uniref:Uncharacterized protein LOC106751478 n=1 Tax=Dinoponera quadriceps TaxID=609295 RepID=A0A6P3YBU4_DINQU|nr:PREDICTED: uncharacterized protein LOC106751478 [Dinoponera quadriceps]